VNTIPTCIAEWRNGNEKMSVYRTAQGRLAVERAEGASLEVYDTVDEVAAHVPAEFAALVRENFAPVG
jgi:hypothetical protein